MINSLVKEILTLNIVPCHRKRERSLIIKEKQFPLCFRCMSMLIGYVFFPIFIVFEISFPLWVGIVLNFPMVLDGVTQKKGLRESTNFLRVVTGLTSGVGQSIMIVGISQFLFQWIEKFS